MIHTIPTCHPGLDPGPSFFLAALKPAFAILAATLLAATTAAAPAHFAWLEYTGTDGAPPPPSQFRNPILAGFYPDPSITRVGDDFYLVNSTFAWFPGIPVFHSRDLVNWRQIGNAIDRPGQLDFQGLGLSRGVFAPDITHDGTRFYIVNTCVDCGGNFVITAADPAGPWSDPTWLPTVPGIDPGLFFDDDGTAWLVNNREPVGGPTYDGHRALWIERFDPKTLKMLGNPKMIVDGGVDLAARPVWIEGPHVIKKDGAYFLTAAEGGTSINHSQVVFRAAAITGPYIPAPVNPILTQRDLPANRPDPVSAAGHADIVDLPGGGWWSIFLAVRPYADDFYNIGRETWLLPVDWSGDWPIILPPGRTVPRLAPIPPLKPTPSAPPTTGSFTVRDDFNAANLGLEWMSMRTAAYTLRNGDLILDRPTTVARRQQHRDAQVTTEVRFTPDEGQSAGLTALQNDDFHNDIAVTKSGGRTLIRVTRRAGKPAPVIIAEQPIIAIGPIRLRITTRAGRQDFAYAVGPDWITLASDVDATNLSTKAAGGFVGTMLGPFMTNPS